MSKGAFLRGQTVWIEQELKAEQYKILLKRLDSLDPKLRRTLQNEIKAIGRPIASQIKSKIPKPNSGYLHGTINRGRLGALTGKVNNVEVNYKSSVGYGWQASITPLLRLQVAHPLAVIMDMGKRVNGDFPAPQERGRNRRAKTLGLADGTANLTREYPYKGGTRRHRISRQARHLFDRIESRQNSPSRFLWPEFETMEPTARKEVMQIINRYAERVNMGFK